MNKNAALNENFNLSEVSEILGISKATVKNWVKLGKLPCISKSPYIFSKEKIMEVHKKLDDSVYLKSRRNKTRINSNYLPGSYIDSSSPNYPIIKSLIRNLESTQIPVWDIISTYARSFCKAKDIPAGVACSLLGKEPSPLPISLLDEYPLMFVEGEDTLGMLYISLRRLGEKKSTGSYYTPFFVVDRIVHEALPETMPFGVKIIDPSCGTGNFLLRLPDEFPPENVYGSDIDPMAVAIARINLVLKYSIRTSSTLDTIKQNIMLQDSLKFFSKESFDYIIGNPPWGYVYPKDEQKVLKEHFVSYNGTGTPESFSLFIEKSLQMLSDNGVMSFLLPESILDVRMHAAIRSLMLDKAQICSISYLGEVFDKVQCPCIILTLKKKCSKNQEDTTKVSFSKTVKSELIIKKSFEAASERLRPSSFHILCDDKDYSLIRKIESVPHFTLKGNAEFALGIVTGSNKTLISDMPLPGYEPIVTGKDIEKYSISAARRYIQFAPERFQQCAPERFYRAKGKLFYRFIADEPIVAMDVDGLLSLNSANIMIPEIDGYSPAYIMAVLNSDIISFYYKNRFRNFKVLRSCLEQLPIPECSVQDREIVEALVKNKDYDALNKKVRSLFTFPV
ncbi:TaqI-like C-terminal specificity domain-containing protein [Butyrivibrio sp. XPD2006]|uniref:TaqI-like C-terminal specificity domain-containing protein n=1 Tax=Butyrivibrio sp. XPD2006 TaxID=1280668 RepID=UPI0003B4C1DC|nr:TaqI-like C-terminal specificity domain-containing protein [Butyrivibrio sp. XPD2006]